MRPRTVRAKIVCLLMVPVVSLLALWAYATVTTAQDVARLRQLQRVDAQVRAPVAAAVAALQAERAAAVRYADRSGRGRGRATSGRSAQRTDRAVAKLRLGDHNTVADGEELPAGVADRLETFVSGAERAAHAADRGPRPPYRMGRDVRAVHAGPSRRPSPWAARSPASRTPKSAPTRACCSSSPARERLWPRRTPYSPGRGSPGASTASGCDCSPAPSTPAVPSPKPPWPTCAARNELPGTTSRRTARTPTLDAVEDKVLAHPPRASGRSTAAPEATWDKAHARVQDGMRTIEADAGREVADRADPFTRGLLTPAGAAVLFGLAAVAASLVDLRTHRPRPRRRAGEPAQQRPGDRPPQTPRGHAEAARGRGDRHPAEAPPGPPAEDETGQVARGPGHRAPRRPARRRGARGTRQRHLRGLRQPRPPQPGPRPPPAEPPGQHGAQVRRPERTRATSSGSTTSPPECGATRRA